MVGMPPVPEAVARWLLAHEAAGNPSPEAVAAAAERVRGRLREGLSVFLGPTGFDSLWARAIHLAQQTSSEAANEGRDPSVARRHDGSEAHDALIAALTSFLTLLFTFVGAVLGVRLIRHVWPDMPWGEAGTPRGDTAP